MAERRSSRPDVSEAIREAVERTVQATIGSAQLTRERAQETVDDIVRSAESRAAGVRNRVRGALDDRRPATAEDVRGLHVELRAIGRRLAALETRLSERDRAPGKRDASAPRDRG
jgi:polyhydroxyalkanoate synthesis regulator phasin